MHTAGTAVAVAHPVGRLLAGLCFLIVLLGVALGILYIVVTGLGDHLHFTHVYPTISSK